MFNIIRYFSLCTTKIWLTKAYKIRQNFPYCYYPNNLEQQMQPQSTHEQQLTKQVLAFMCLLKNQNSQGQLKRISKKLFKTGIKEIATGQKLFDEYIRINISKYIEQINGNNKELKLAALKSILYLQDLQLLRDSWSQIQQSNIKSCEEKIIYIGILIKIQQDYLDYVQQLYTILQKQSNIQSALLVFSINNFKEYFPQTIIKKCLNVVTSQISQINPFHLLKMLGILYQCPSSSELINFIERLTQSILNHLVQLHIPLILKTIKFRSHLHLDSQKLIDFIKRNPDFLKLIFIQKDYNKQVFLPLLVSEANILEEQYKQQFEKYIIKQFQKLRNINEINIQSTIRLIKLILKYYHNLSKGTNYQICQILDDILGRLNYTQLQYYCLLFLCRSEASQKYLNTILKSILKIQPKLQQIDKQLNIYYQIYRFKLQDKIQDNNYPKLFTNFNQQYQLSHHQINYYFYLLKYLPISTKDKTLSINCVKKSVMNKFSNGNISSMKIIFITVDALSRINYKQDKYMWVNIQTAIQSILKNTNYKISFNDIKFFKKNLVDYNRCSRKFNEFILSSLKDYDSFDRYKQKYIEKAQMHTYWRKKFKEQKNNKKQ